jgi:chaperone required for assembly of F1-ATPase
VKRFYKTVSVEEAHGRFAIALDSRAVRTPAKSALAVPSEALARAIAAEWEAQGDEVKPHAMPLTRLASTAIDKVAAERARLVDELAGYAESDLLCYRAELPPELVARQEAQWQPLLDWAADRFAARLEVTQGVLPRVQPAASLKALRTAVEAQDDMGLAALHSATTAAGSLVIALALLEDRLAADEAFALSQLDESFQIEQWGEDAEAVLRREAIRDELRAVAEFMALCHKDH